MSAMQPGIAAAPSVIRPRVPLAAVLAIACIAQFMVVLDTTIVNVALPAIRQDLGLTISQQQWVIDAYLVTFGGFLLLASAASDLLGRKIILQAGLAVFTAASLIAGLATSGPMLLTARVVQGIGAAGLAPSSLSLITATHHDARQRSRALAIWGACASGAAAVGVVLGGVLTDELSWRWVMFVNVPIGVTLYLSVTMALLPAARSFGRPQLDVPGALSVTVGVGALVYGISRAPELGWGSAQVIAALVGAALLLGTFVGLEAKSPHPLVRLEIFRLPALPMANLVMFCLAATLTGSLFFLSLYFQEILGCSAVRAGLALLPMGAVLSAGAPVARRLVTAGFRYLAAWGAVASAAGLLWLTRLPLHPAYLTHVLGPTLVLGSGLSMTLLPAVMAATTGVPPRDAGIASGLVNVTRQIGGAVGLAVLVTIASSVTDAGRQHRIATPAGVLHGYHVALVAAAGISLIGALAAVSCSRPRASGPRPVLKPDSEPAAKAVGSGSET